MKKLKKAFHKIKKFFRGFTIIEVIVAVSVIGVLASILVVSVSSYINKSKDSKIKAEISEIIGGAGMYYAENFTINGYDIPGSFDLASSGSDYVFSTNGSDAYVVYAKLSTSDNYWCADSTGNSAELESSPDAGVYTCIPGTGAILCIDSDEDNYGACPNCQIANGCVSDGDDCDDTNPAINPGAVEICGNYIDDDCVGGDEECVSLCFDQGDGFLEGDGSSGDPWQVCDCNMLQSIGSHLAGNFMLVDNIDCSETSTWNSGAGWQPIGNSMMPFTGNFNGQGYTITGLIINRPYSNEVGLFGQIGTMTSINNLKITSATINGSSRVGILAGNNFGSINKVYTSGSVTTSNYYTGGLVGYSQGMIQNSYSDASVTSTSDEAGGLIGWTEGMVSISNSYATGNVNGYRKVGGLIGETSAGTYITNCYATGSVSATEMQAGGLVGLNYGYVSNSFSTGSVSANSYEGGLIGFATGMSAIISDCYWNNHSTNPEVCIGEENYIGNSVCNPINNNEPYFYSSSNPPMSSWNFSTIWQENSGTYPTLR